MRSLDPVTNYATLVNAGIIIAGPHVRNACARHLRDILRDDIYLDLDEMNRVIGFFEKVLVLSEGQFEGRPFILEPVQKFIIGSIFGWRRKSTKLRRFRRAYVEIAKGSGKSPLCGGIGLLGLCADNEPGAQIYAAASRKDQAGILFQDAVKMVKQSPDLDERLVPSGLNPVYQLTYPDNGSFFKPISKEAGKTGSGPRPHFALCDEVHEHPDRSIMEMLERGFKFRRQPLIMMITNSGSDRNSVCWEEHEHAIKVAAGDADDDTTFSFVCSLDENDDPFTDESCWIKANPLLGVTLTYDYLRDIVKQAIMIPGKMNNILRLHFCLWTDSDKAWISRKAFTDCEDPEMKLEDFIGEDCWEGLDLSAVKDLTARAKVFRDGVDDKGRPKYALFAHGYTPAETLLEREKIDKAPYSVWVDQGYLTATPGKVISFEQVIHDIVEDSVDYNLMVVAYDRYLIRPFENIMAEMGAVFEIMEHPQGMNQRKDTRLWMPESIDTFETLILEKRIRIAVNPVLRSCVASACFDVSPAGLKRFAKNKSTSRIDLAVAAAMAIGAATLYEKVETQSYTANNGVVFL